MVSDLFLPGTRRWDEELLDCNFYLWEVEIIKGIYVSQVVDTDTLVWPLTPDGMYSVRSAYWLYSELSRQALPSSSTGEGDKGLWNGIWKLRVPPKVRHFLWRVVCDALPTKINLLK